MMMLFIMIPAATLTTDAAIAPTKMWVEPTAANGLPIKIEVITNKVKVQTGTSWGQPVFTEYTYNQLFLPGNTLVDVTSTTRI